MVGNVDASDGNFAEFRDLVTIAGPPPFLGAWYLFKPSLSSAEKYRYVALEMQPIAGNSNFMDISELEVLV